MQLQPSFGWRVFNALRRWLEDRHAEEGTTIAQMKALRQRSDRRKTEFKGLRLIRDSRRNAA